MRKKLAIVVCIVAGGLLAVALWLASFEADRTSDKPVAYIACRDNDFQNQRVYRTDPLSGGVLGVSEPIDWMGNPTQLTIDTKRSRLFVGSFRGKARDYYPMTVVNVQDKEFEVVNRFTTNPEDILPRDSTQWNEKPFEVYQIAVSPDGDELYVGHGAMSEGTLTAVWNADTGKVLRELATYVDPGDVWSPDGRYVAGIWPSRERIVETNGVPMIETVHAGVDVRDVQTGRRVSLTYLEDGRGLQPPWGKLKGPLIRVDAKTGEVRTYDRDAGDIVSEFNIKELTGLRMGEGGTWVQPDTLEDKEMIVLDMVCYEPLDESVTLDCDFSTWSDWRIPKLRRTYVVVVNVIQQRELSRTEVGMHCTNPVVVAE